MKDLKNNIGVVPSLAPAATDADATSTARASDDARANDAGARTG